MSNFKKQKGTENKKNSLLKPKKTQKEKHGTEGEPQDKSNIKSLSSKIDSHTAEKKSNSKKESEVNESNPEPKRKPIVKKLQRKQKNNLSVKRKKITEKNIEKKEIKKQHSNLKGKVVKSKEKSLPKDQVTEKNTFLSTKTSKPLIPEKQQNHSHFINKESEETRPLEKQNKQKNTDKEIENNRKRTHKKVPEKKHLIKRNPKTMTSINNLTPEQHKCYSNLHDAISENEKYLSLLNEYRNKLKVTDTAFRLGELHAKTVGTVGQMVGEIITKMTDEKFIVKTSQGPRYVVGARKSLDRNKLVSGTRVALDITTMTVMKILNREIDPTIFAMSEENPGDVDFQNIGGLSDQVRQLKEIITLPLDTPEIFSRVGIMEPKGVLLYGPPGTGKTLLARAIAATMDVTFLKVVASSLIEKYIGESSRMIREMFSYARQKTPCIIFLDEIDAIGSKRSSDSSSSDREVQRTLMELLNQLDGFHALDRVKVIMATNRPDILDPALLRPGRLDRKIEIPLPNENGRKEILGIYTKNMNKHGKVDLDMLVSLSSGLNGADLRHVCTEAGMNAIRDDRDFVRMDDFVKAVRKVMGAKKLETKLEYKKP